jgi:homoserine kinase
LSPTKIPGLPKILSTLTPESHPGLLGICLSGAGPTILALATDNFDGIASSIKDLFSEEGVEVDWEVLEVDERGSWFEDLGEYEGEKQISPGGRVFGYEARRIPT